MSKLAGPDREYGRDALRQGVSGTPHYGRVGYGRGTGTGNVAAARPLILGAPPRCGPAILVGALALRARPWPEAQWVIVPNVTSGDQIVCQMIPEAGSVAETI